MYFYRRVCEAVVKEFLARSIRKGSLILNIATNLPQKIIFGETALSASNAGRPVAEINIHDASAFYGRVASSADIGFAEAFILGDFSVDSPQQLTNVFLLLILNRDSGNLSSSFMILSWLGIYVNKVLHSWNRNTIIGAQRNIQAHYDLSNELFSTFLGKTWTYSCAYFGSAAKPILSLDEAQHAKLDMIIEKAIIEKDMHILDIGCGWGELAIRAAKQTGCKVTGITLSQEQLTLARARAADAGVQDLVQFELLDYRHLPAQEVLYDRVISIEMLEAVGHEFFGTYFEVLEHVLKPAGLVVLQVITTPEERYEEYRQGTDFIQKYIFPGGICPSLEALMRAMASSSRLCIEHVENIGPHYAGTLAEWRRRFLESVKEGRVAAAGFDEEFVRKWLYYFSYCEAGFASRTLGTLQIVLSRPNNNSTLGNAPQIGGVNANAM